MLSTFNIQYNTIQIQRHDATSLLIKIHYTVMYAYQNTDINNRKNNDTEMSSNFFKNIFLL